MSFLNTISQVYFASPLINVLLVPFLMCAILFALYKKRDEFSFHAIRNISATIVLGGMNFLVAFFLFDEINSIMQAAYRALAIPTLNPDIWKNAPYWLTVLTGVVAKDFVDYWNHRLMHTRWVWPTHAAHHSDTHVNAFTSYRVHFLESLIMTGSYILLLTWMQIPSAIPAVVMLSALHNHYVHMDLPYTHGPLRYLLASPMFHRWHHADTPDAYGKNLANIMPLWDRLFGTYHNPHPCNAEMGALKSGIEDKNPVLIFIYPFRQWARMIRRRLKRLNTPQKRERLDSATRY